MYSNASDGKVLTISDDPEEVQEISLGPAAMAVENGKEAAVAPPGVEDEIEDLEK